MAEFMLEAKVDITEALGEYTLLYLQQTDGAENFIAKLPGTHKELRDQTIPADGPPCQSAPISRRAGYALACSIAHLIRLK